MSRAIIAAVSPRPLRENPKLTIACTECHTRYMPNYKVTRASEADAERVYFEELPYIMGATRTSYFEVKLIEVFRQAMVTLQ